MKAGERVSIEHILDTDAMIIQITTKAAEANAPCSDVLDAVPACVVERESVGCTPPAVGASISELLRLSFAVASA